MPPHAGNPRTQRGAKNLAKKSMIRIMLIFREKGPRPRVARRPAQAPKKKQNVIVIVSDEKNCIYLTCLLRFTRDILKYTIYPNPGYSTGQAIEDAKDSFASLNFKDIGYQFKGLSRIQDNSGGQILFLYLMAALAVFLVLSA